MITHPRVNYHFVFIVRKLTNESLLKANLYILATLLTPNPDKGIERDKVIILFVVAENSLKKTSRVLQIAHINKVLEI